jgi:GTP cyclohydrolase IA
MSGQDNICTLAGGSLIAARGTSELVVARSIPFHSLCQHHLLPFHGVANVGYVPGENQVGLAEFTRIVEACSRGIQVQQRMTSRIGLWLQHRLAPRGVGVLVQAVHCCKTASGAPSSVEKTTTAFFGSLRLSADERREFLALARQHQ